MGSSVGRDISILLGQASNKNTLRLGPLRRRMSFSRNMLNMVPNGPTSVPSSKPSKIPLIQGQKTQSKTNFMAL